MAYQNQKDEGSFYRLTKDGKKLEKLFDKVAISNGMDWTKDNSQMFYIDTLTMKVEVFDYKPLQSRVIENRRTFISIGENMGYPDGMCTDSQDNLWVAFWMGSCVRGYDGKTGKQIAEIKLPNPKVTSCCFGGEKLDKLIITTAVGNPGENMDLIEFPTAGFTFVAEPGVTGKPTNLFQV
jgi:gluconolactonase